MVMAGYKTKDSVVLVYTGNGKGKTSAALGLLSRALGSGRRCGFLQFIKAWEVAEHKFFRQIRPLYKGKFDFYRGGKGFYNLGSMSARGVNDDTHREAARKTYERAIKWSQGGRYDLVICDEINTAFQEKLLTKNQLKRLITHRHSKTSLCLTGRGFPADLIELADIATEMKKLKHHFDDKFLANPGIDY